jgi:hypothetical protein
MEQQMKVNKTKLNSLLIFVATTFTATTDGNIFGGMTDNLHEICVHCDELSMWNFPVFLTFSIKIFL